MVVVVVVSPVLWHFVFHHLWCVDWTTYNLFWLNQNNKNNSPLITDLGRMQSSWQQLPAGNLSGKMVLGFDCVVVSFTRYMCFGVYHWSDPTGDHWPQKADGDGEPGDWRPREEVHQKGGGHQRTERTGQGHRRPQVRFVFHSLVPLKKCLVLHCYPVKTINCQHLVFITTGSWGPVKEPSIRRSSAISSWSLWLSTTSGETSGRNCVAPAWGYMLIYFPPPQLAMCLLQQSKHRQLKIKQNNDRMWVSFIFLWDPFLTMFVPL